MLFINLSLLKFQKIGEIYMNIYDKYFDFRMATIDDIDEIMLFLKKVWSENHILANDRKLFQWQYGNEQFGDKNAINVVLMLDKNKKIAGMNGFIPYAALPEERYVSSAITVVRPDLEIPQCGIELIKRFKEIVPAKAYYSSGTNPRTMIPIGKRIFHYETGIMQQYYMINNKFTDFKVARINHHVSSEYCHTEILLRPLQNMSEAEKCFKFERKEEGQGYKSKEFLDKRYFKHPVYQYKIYGVQGAKEQAYLGILVGREIEIHKHKILRLVDYIGNLTYIGSLGTALHQLMDKNDYEYIDMMVGTLPRELMSQAGFSLRELEDTNVIPTYFEPFVQENVNIWYQKSDPDIVIFKADGDQDRPNRR